MTYNWYDTRASTWYEGYGPGGGPSHANEGSFVDLTTMTAGTDEYNTALSAITNNITALFEQKGVTAEQAQNSQQYKDLVNTAVAGDTKAAFQGAAAVVTDASDRGDLYGAATGYDHSTGGEGGDQSKGKTFLEDVAAGKVTATVNDLFESGLLRQGDTSGLDYWDGKLASGMGIEAIASSFLASDEAQLQQGYSDQYSRTGTVHTYTDSSGDVHVDETKGLGYWLSDNSEKATGVSDLENFLKVTSYKGEDQDNDGKISFEEALTSKYNVSAETLVTDAKQDILGQVSNKANKANNPFFTAANVADTMKYVNHIRDARTGGLSDATTGERLAGVGNKDAAYDDSLFTNTHIGYRGLTIDALNQGDVDDYQGEDLDGDGQITGDEITANPTGMGRFGTTAEVKEYMDAHSGVDSGNLRAAQDSNKFGRTYDDTHAYGQKVFSSVMDKKWGALTNEKVKDIDDYVPYEKPFTGELTKAAAEQLLLKENLDHWKKNSTIWGGDQGGGGNGGGGDGGGWTPDIPDKPGVPDPIEVDRKTVDYMPKLTSDVQDTSDYKTAKQKFDSATVGLPYTRQAAQSQTGQRFTDKSAKGVRMNRSKASRMGTIRGTARLGREQQLKSLNI